MLPLGDSPNPPGVPVANYLLIAVNFAVFVLITLPLSGTGVDPRDPVAIEYLRTIAEISHRPVILEEAVRSLTAYDLFVFQHGFRVAQPSAVDLLFSMFLHGGLMHLVGNMLFLSIYGDNVEYRLGHVRYLLAYLGTGIAATLFYMVVDSGSSLPLVGASGAISGVLGLYFIWFPRNRVKVLLLLPWYIDVIALPARLLLGMYLVMDNLFPFLLTRGTRGGGVAYGAHLGGFVAGLIIAGVTNRATTAAADTSQ